MSIHLPLDFVEFMDQIIHILPTLHKRNPHSHQQCSILDVAHLTSPQFVSQFSWCKGTDTLNSKDPMNI